MGEHRGVLITASQLESWTGHLLTDDQVSRLERSIEHSTVPDAIGTMAEAMFGDEPGWRTET